MAVKKTTSKEKTPVKAIETKKDTTKAIETRAAVLKEAAPVEKTAEKPAAKKAAAKKVAPAKKAPAKRTTKRAEDGDVPSVCRKRIYRKRASPEGEGCMDEDPEEQGWRHEGCQDLPETRRICGILCHQRRYNRAR